MNDEKLKKQLVNNTVLCNFQIEKNTAFNVTMAYLYAGKQKHTLPKFSSKKLKYQGKYWQNNNNDKTRFLYSNYLMLNCENKKPGCTDQTIN